jgi:hypothetical protein
MQNPLRRSPTKQYEELRYAAAQARLPFDKDSWLNIAFYLDEQYVEWRSDSSSIRSIPREEGNNMPRPVSNKIMHFVSTEHSMVLQARPTVDVLPATDDPISVSNSAVALAYLKWLADPQVADFDGSLSQAVLWALVAGEGFLKWTFNQKAQRGEITACSPLDVFPDPYATDFRKARYVIHSQFMDVEQVYDIYGKEVKPSDTKTADITKTTLLRDMGQAPVLSGAVVNELWMKPSRRHPEGMFVVWTGNEVLYGPTPFPYEHGHLPFTQIGSIPRPGSAHYTCAVKYLRNPQMELNQYHAQRIMIRKNFANPKWWLPTDLELENDPDDSPNQVLRGNSNGGLLRPEIIQPTAFAMGDEGEFIAGEMMDTVGLHEVSQAQVPGRVEAAKAIELLKESDANRQSELLRTIKNAISHGFYQELRLAKQYVSGEKIVETYSREGVPEVRKFKSEVIDEGMRVNITMGTGLAKSRAAREDQVYKMIEGGIITDPEIAAELLDIPVGTVMPNKSFDIRVARNENMTMADSTPVVPNSWDDHEIHIREHNMYRKTSEFLSLPEDAKNMFEFHVETHEQLQIQQLQKMLMKQMMVQQVAGGPEGGESQEQAPAQQAA